MPLIRRNPNNNETIKVIPAKTEESPIVVSVRKDIEVENNLTTEQLDNNNDTTVIDPELAELEAKMQELNILRASKIVEAERKRKEAEQAKPVKILVDALSGVFISIVRSEERADVTDLIKSIPSARFPGYGYRKALIPVAEWKGFREKVETLPNVSFRITNAELKKELEYLLDTPPWTLSLTERWIIAKWGPGADSFIFQSLAGTEYDYKKKEVKIPLTEAHNAYGRLENVQGVVWDEDAQEFVLKQIERRGKLDQIALMKVSEKYKNADLNGIILRDFQTVGAEFIEATGGNALVGDDMGLGKTYQSLAYVKANKDIIKKSVVICKASLKPKWIREVKKIFGENVKYYVPSTSIPTEFDFIALFKNGVEVLIINFDLVGEFTKGKTEGVNEKGYKTENHAASYLWARVISTWGPDCIIVDESHSIKNLDAHRTKAIMSIKCPRWVCLSGTPVLNRPGELWTTLNLIAPEQFPAYETFLRQYTIDGKRARNVEELRGFLKSLMIRRLKKDVMAELPPVNRIKEWHTLSQKAMRMYEKVLEGVYEAVADYNPQGYGGDQQQVANILAKIMRLKQVCAISKAEQTADLAIELYEQTDESERRKVLIFSQFKPVAYKIAQLLEKDRFALSFVERTPKEFKTVSAEERDKLVTQFQNDPDIRYLVVTEKTATEGHDITAAGHVIFNDLFWTPAGHEQAEGRAYGRLNDPHPINSYWMITDMGGESIEEWIMEMLDRKLGVIRETIEGLNDERDINIVGDLIKKIKESMYVNRRKR